MARDWLISWARSRKPEEMLRITSQTPVDGTARFRLDGRLTQTCVPGLDRALRPSLGGPSRVALDVSGLTFVDAEGAQVLKDLMARNVTIHGCSSFVARLIGLS